MPSQQPVPCYFDPVVKKVDSTKGVKLKSDESHVFIDEKTNKAVEGSWANRNNPLKKLQSYHVSTYSRVNCKDISFLIEDVQANKSITILASYELRIQRGEEGRAVEALTEEITPAVSLHKFIERTIQHEHDTQKFHRNDFIDRFYDLKANLQTKLTSEAKNRGLTLSCTLRLKDEDKLRTIEISSNDYLSITVGGRKQNLKYKLDLGIAPEYKVNAVRRYTTSTELATRLKLKVNKRIEKVFREKKIDATTFVNSLNSEAKEILTREIDKALVAEGRKVSYLQLSRKTEDFSPEEFIQFSFKKTYKLMDYEPVLEHQITLELDRDRKENLYKSGIAPSNIKSWIEKKVFQETHKQLAGKYYSDLALRFEQMEEIIKQVVTIEANKIGYRLQVFTSKPEIEEVRLHRDGFKFFVGGENNPFKTKDSVSAEVRIEISGKIQDLSKISKWIKPNPEISLQERMKDNVRDTIRRALYEIDAERFYIRYESKEAEETETVKERLEKAVKKVLREIYGAGNLDIYAIQLESDLSKIFGELMKGFHPFSVSSFNEQSKYTAYFNVYGMSPQGWRTFKNLGFELDENGQPSGAISMITDFIERYIEDQFADNTGIEENTLHEDDEFIDWRQTLFQDTEKEILKDFGLQIRIRGKRREISLDEAKIKVELQKRQNARLIEYEQDTTRRLKQREIHNEYNVERSKTLLTALNKAERTGDKKEVERLTQLISNESKSLSSRDDISNDLHRLGDSANDRANRLKNRRKKLPKSTSDSPQEDE